MQRARRKSERATGIALLFLLCIGTGLGAVHEARNPHRYCPEHGVLEESHGGQGAVAPAGPRGHLVSGRLLTSHQACPFAHALGVQIEPSLAPSVTRLWREARLPVPPRAESLAPSRILSFAPKTSPPITA
jgi:hypothetical protein